MFIKRKLYFLFPYSKDYSSNINVIFVTGNYVKLLKEYITLTENY